MKIRFRETPRKRRHGSRGINLRRDGETRDVSPEDADHLLKYWPDNFERIALSLEELGPALRKVPKLSELSIVVTYYNIQVLESSLLSCVPHQTELIKLDNSNGRWASIAQALNYGIRKAGNDIIICAHQDTRFEESWFADFVEQESRLDNWGTLGITGFDIDRKVHWGSDYNAPRKIAFLDECCIILNRKNGLLFDEDSFKSWHRYGIDFCLQCHSSGLGVYLITGPAHHDCYPEVHPGGWWEQRRIDQRLLEEKWDGKFPELLGAVIN